MTGIPRCENCAYRKEIRDEGGRIACTIFDDSSLAYDRCDFWKELKKPRRKDGGQDE